MAEIPYRDILGHTVQTFGHKSIVINTVIAESLVNENFGNDLTPLNHNYLKECFGLLYSEIPVRPGKPAGRIAFPVRSKKLRCTWNIEVIPQWRVSLNLM